MEQIKVGDKYEIFIDNMAHDGQGVGRLNGIAVFVHGALKGETVIAKIDKIHKNYLVAHEEKILKKSQDRIIPKCPYFNKCGGCMLQHLNYKGQLEFKTQKVKENLKRIGKIDAEVYDTIGMQNPYSYRNKAEYAVATLDNYHVTGFYMDNTHDVIQIDGCMLQNEISNKTTQIIKQWMNLFNIESFNINTNKGLLRNIITKIGHKTNDIMVVLVINGNDIPHKEKLIKMLNDKLTGLKSVVLNINMGRSKNVMGDKNITIYGKNFITDYIDDIKFEISPLSFYQVNPIMTEILYKKALKYADLIGNEIVLDIYCGIGTISLFFAKHSKFVYGIEIVKQAVEDAQRNASINKIDNVKFLAGKAEDKMPNLLKKGIKPDAIVMDPPRKGCDESVLEACIKMKPKKMIYVSCNSSTLARDLRYLFEYGYKTEKVQPIDMFPYTYHVEMVCLLSKIDKGTVLLS